jgi:hypothetical protein
VAIAAGGSYDYRRSQSFSQPGTYTFEVVWQDSSSNWHQVPADPGVSRTANLIVSAADLAITEISWEPNQTPREYEPFNLNLKVENQGDAPYEPGDGQYRVSVVLEDQFVATAGKYPLLFDTRNPTLGAHLSPSQLPRIGAHGENVIVTVTNLRLPQTFIGQLKVTLIPSQKDGNQQNDSKTVAVFNVDPVPGIDDCLMVFGKALIASAFSSLPELVPEHPEYEVVAQLLEKVTDDFLDFANTVRHCNGDSTCTITAWADFLKKLAYIVPGPGTDLKEWLLLVVRSAVDEFIQVAKCAAYIANYLGKLSDLINRLIGIGFDVNSTSISSTAYVLATNASGQRAGFLDDGTIVQEIPGAQVLSSPNGRLVLYPGTNTRTIRVKGAATGTFSLDLALSRNSSVRAGYRNVQVFATTIGLIDAGDTTYTLSLDDNGDGVPDRQKPPDELTISHCPGDASGDGVVNAVDLSILASEWGKDCSQQSCEADFNHDGIVNAADLSILAANWGKRCQ